MTMTATTATTAPARRPASGAHADRAATASGAPFSPWRPGVRKPAAEPPLSGRRKALLSVFRTDDGLAGPVLRLTLALVIWPHGAQKAFGWFGGPGFEGIMGWLTADVGVPWLVALSVVAAELLAPVALLAGALVRPAALGIAAVMVGAVVTTHLPYGFFMDWEGTRGGQGFEYHLLVLGMVAAILVVGGGRLSVDRLLARVVRRTGA